MIIVVFRHLGPGTHPSGTPQSVHGQQGLTLHDDVFSDHADDEQYLEFSDLAEARDFMHDEFRHYGRGLTGDNFDALNDYEGVFAELINRTARGEKFELPPDVYRIMEDLPVEREIELLDQAMAAHELSVPILVYRGLKTQYVADLKPGDVYSDKAFVSTSLLKKVAKGKYFGGKGHSVLEIQLPPGTECGTCIVDDIESSREVEITLPRNSRFKVISVSEFAVGRKAIRMELIS